MTLDTTQSKRKELIYRIAHNSDAEESLVDDFIRNPQVLPEYELVNDKYSFSKPILKKKLETISMREKINNGLSHSCILCASVSAISLASILFGSRSPKIVPFLFTGMATAVCTGVAISAKRRSNRSANAREFYLLLEDSQEVIATRLTRQTGQYQTNEVTD